MSTNAGSASNKKRKSSDSSNPALSKNIMQLKFMQRKMESELRRQKEDEQNKAYQEAHWVLGEEDSSDALLVEEAVDIGDTGGRRSFKNFNPTVEKMNREAKATEKGSATRKSSAPRSSKDDEGADVSAQEMVSRYEKFVKGGSIKGNNNSNSSNNGVQSQSSHQNKKAKRD